MAIRNPDIIDSIKAYFQGGNAKDKVYTQIEADLKTIRKVIEEENPQKEE